MAITIDRIRKWNIPQRRIILPFDDPLATVNLTSAEHLERMEELVNRYRTKLVVVDSLRGGHGDDENNSRIGGVLKSLASIAERTNAAVVVVHHTRKLMDGEEISPNSSRGSNAILAMMRSQIGIDKPDPTSRWCRVRVLKENLGLAPKPAGFRVTNSGLEFGAPPEKPQRQTDKDEAANWLRERMKPGRSYNASKIICEAEQHGHVKRTVQRAATKVLGIRPEGVRKKGRFVRWTWRVPDGRGFE